MFGGLGIGLLGLTWYESKYMKSPSLAQKALLQMKGPETLLQQEKKQEYLQMVEIIDSNCYNKK
jgi:hypothetical protein